MYTYILPQICLQFMSRFIYVFDLEKAISDQLIIRPTEEG
jgi:hypothetical protein